MENVCKLYSDLKTQAKKIKEIKERLIDFLRTVPNQTITIGRYEMRIKQKKKQKAWNKELLRQCMATAFEGELTADEIDAKIDQMCEAKTKMSEDQNVDELDFKEHK